MRIAVAVDLSVESHFALRWALDLRDHLREQGYSVETYAYTVPADAEQFASQNLAGYSRTDEEPGVHRWMVRKIREFLEAVRPDVDDVEIVVEEGKVAEKLTEFCEANDVDWLVVGQSTVGPLARLVMGSIVHDLTDQAPSRLVIVHPEHSRLEDNPELVVGIDFLPGSDAALMSAAELTQWTDGRLHLVHALEDAPTGATTSRTGPRSSADIARLTDEARHSLEGLMGKVRERYPDLDYTTFVHSGRAKRVLAKLIERRGADAAFFGKVDHSTIEKWLFGSVSRALLRQMPTTMVLVPPE